MSNLVLTRKGGQSVRIDAALFEVLRVGKAEVIAKVGNEHRKLRIADTWRDIGECFVTVVSISKGYAKLAFDAPRSVTIVRSEINGR
jgi:sRNA-binding carbon storage regulator CsrA